MGGAFGHAPQAERPRTPDVDYGVPAEGGSMIGWAESVERLRTAEAYWLATTGPDRAPHVVPVWGVLVGDDLYLETGAPNTKKARNLAANPSVAVHLDGINDALIVPVGGECLNAGGDRCGRLVWRPSADLPLVDAHHRGSE